MFGLGLVCGLNVSVSVGGSELCVRLWVGGSSLGLVCELHDRYWLFGISAWVGVSLWVWCSPMAQNGPQTPTPVLRLRRY